MIDERELIKILLQWKENGNKFAGLKKVDEYELPKGAGFYDFDSEWGYYVSGCDYWCEIEWEDKE